jgi:hypothetical protein
MAEQTWTEEHILASDLWGVERVLEPESPEEHLAAWKQAVVVLGDLGKLGRRCATTLSCSPLVMQ